MAVAAPSRTAATVERLEVAAYTVPAAEPESDGTLRWDATTAIVVRAHGGGMYGLGYTYGSAAIAKVVAQELAPVVEGAGALAPQAAWGAMSRAVRNSLNTGLCRYAISAVDVALHDLKARLLGVSLADLLGRWHDDVAIYGSGGFTSLSDAELHRQAGGWRALGVHHAKIKVGRDPSADARRLAVVRDALGPDVALMVDANGVFPTPARALAAAHGAYGDHGVVWLEEPVSSEDHTGLRRVRDGAPPGMEIAAGEYLTSAAQARRLLEAGAVDVLQADATRCGGVTGVRHLDGLAKAHGTPLSAHCAPAVSAHVFAACETTVHLEYFHDHVRVEALLFDGVPEPHDGRLVPDRSRPGLGLELRESDLDPYRA